MPLSHPIYLMPKLFLYTFSHQGEDSLKSVHLLVHFDKDPFHHTSLRIINDLCIKKKKVRTGFYSIDMLSPRPSISFINTCNRVRLVIMIIINSSVIKCKLGEQQCGHFSFTTSDNLQGTPKIHSNFLHSLTGEPRLFSDRRICQFLHKEYLAEGIQRTPKFSDNLNIEKN